MSSRQISFIGLGIMGLPMAQRLLNGGHALTIHTRTKSRAKALLDAGCTWAATPAEAAANAEVTFICVTDTPDVQAVVTGPHGVIESAKSGSIVVDHSTISPSVTRELSCALAERGVQMLDAPVSGGDIGAHEGTLAIMIGGNEQAFDRAAPLLRLMGKTITYCGRSGNGQLTKLVNQILVSINALAVAEAMAFATRSGLDPTKTLEAVGAGAAGSWQLNRLWPKMIARDWNPGFTIDLQLKDLRLVLEAARQAAAAIPGTALASDMFKNSQSAGHGREATTALLTAIEQLSESASDGSKSSATAKLRG